MSDDYKRAGRARRLWVGEANRGPRPARIVETERKNDEDDGVHFCAGDCGSGGDCRGASDRAASCWATNSGAAGSGAIRRGASCRGEAANSGTDAAGAESEFAIPAGAGFDAAGWSAEGRDSRAFYFAEPDFSRDAAYLLGVR